VSIPRCEHGVYSPDGDGRPSDYCTGCTVPTKPLVTYALAEDETEESSPALCPDCETELVVRDEYDLLCANCGFNDL
jgi:hypothetical protein